MRDVDVRLRAETPVLLLLFGVVEAAAGTWAGVLRGHWHALSLYNVVLKHDLVLWKVGLAQLDLFDVDSVAQLVLGVVHLRLPLVFALQRRHLKLLLRPYDIQVAELVGSLAHFKFRGEAELLELIQYLLIIQDVGTNLRNFVARVFNDLVVRPQLLVRDDIRLTDDGHLLAEVPVSQHLVAQDVDHGDTWFLLGAAINLLLLVFRRQSDALPRL